jgi:isochorismate synthase
MKLQEPLHVVEAVNKLAEKYPNAFISAVYLPEFDSVWLGASPELLVSIDENGLFKTMSLAGTQSAYDSDGARILPGHARWSQKEIEEQALVSRYIIECFKKVRVREYLENGPKTVEAGNLLHLQTDFVVDTNAIEFKQFSTVLLELLHPTSAVCGMPKPTALDFILQNENYSREFYCGFLGPINIEKASHVFVNLRTLKLMGNTVNFYAGAGITEDSIPEKEWYETEMKIDTLYSVLF